MICDTMPNIRPISDLRNNFNEISDLCHREGEPVFITRNGRGDMVVMSLAAYERQQTLLELFRKLDDALDEDAGSRGRLTHREMMKKLRRGLDE